MQLQEAVEAWFNALYNTMDAIVVVGTVLTWTTWYATMASLMAWADLADATLKLLLCAAVLPISPQYWD